MRSARGNGSRSRSSGPCRDRGDDEALTREGGTGLESAVGEEIGDAFTLGQVGGAWGPSGADELAERGGLGLTGAAFASVGH